ncbi:MAG: response regulator transcription factor [Nocardiopsaceae bacterium]|nr:response regulator transcription factor [Nocardiopsaceae bacterium]
MHQSLIAAPGPRPPDRGYGRSSLVIRTLVAEPTALPREGLVAILSREPDIELVATARSGTEAVSAARTLRPDVALLSAFFPADGGIRGWIAVAAAAKQAAPECQYAILSPDWQRRDLRRAAAAGVRGFLACDSPADELIAAVRRLAAGGKVFGSRQPDSTSSPLTPREADVLRAAEGGATTAEIAAALCLSDGTVRNYLSRAIAKTGARNRLGAVRTAAESGWL